MGTAPSKMKVWADPTGLPRLLFWPDQSLGHRSNEQPTDSLCAPSGVGQPRVPWHSLAGKDATTGPIGRMSLLGWKARDYRYGHLPDTSDLETLTLRLLA
jgi:hypothetical protein